MQIEKITDLELEASRYETRIKSLKEELSNTYFNAGMEKQLRIKEVETVRIRMDAEKMKLNMELK